MPQDGRGSRNNIRHGTDKLRDSNDAASRTSELDSDQQVSEAYDRLRSLPRTRERKEQKEFIKDMKRTHPDLWGKLERKIKREKHNRAASSKSPSRNRPAPQSAAVRRSPRLVKDNVDGTVYEESAERFEKRSPLTRGGPVPLVLRSLREVPAWLGGPLSPEAVEREKVEVRDLYHMSRFGVKSELPRTVKTEGPSSAPPTPDDLEPESIPAVAWAEALLRESDFAERDTLLMIPPDLLTYNTRLSHRSLYAFLNTAGGIGSEGDRNTIITHLFLNFSLASLVSLFIRTEASLVVKQSYIKSMTRLDRRVPLVMRGASGGAPLSTADSHILRDGDCRKHAGCLACRPGRASEHCLVDFDNRPANILTYNLHLSADTRSVAFGHRIGSDSELRSWLKKRRGVSPNSKCLMCLDNNLNPEWELAESGSHLKPPHVSIEVDKVQRGRDRRPRDLLPLLRRQTLLYLMSTVNLERDCWKPIFAHMGELGVVKGPSGVDLWETSFKRRFCHLLQHERSKILQCPVKTRSLLCTGCQEFENSRRSAADNANRRKILGLSADRFERVDGCIKRWLRSALGRKPGNRTALEAVVSDRDKLFENWTAKRVFSQWIAETVEAVRKGEVTQQPHLDSDREQIRMSVECVFFSVYDRLMARTILILALSHGIERCDITTPWIYPKPLFEVDPATGQSSMLDNRWEEVREVADEIVLHLVNGRPGQHSGASVDLRMKGREISENSTMLAVRIMILFESLESQFLPFAPAMRKCPQGWLQEAERSYGIGGIKVPRYQVSKGWTALAATLWGFREAQLGTISEGEAFVAAPAYRRSGGDMAVMRMLLRLQESLAGGGLTHRKDNYQGSDSESSYDDIDAFEIPAMRHNLEKSDLKYVGDISEVMEGLRTRWKEKGAPCKYEITNQLVWILHFLDSRFDEMRISAPRKKRSLSDLLIELRQAYRDTEDVLDSELSAKVERGREKLTNVMVMIQTLMALASFFEEIDCEGT